VLIQCRDLLCSLHGDHHRLAVSGCMVSSPWAMQAEIPALLKMFTLSYSFPFFVVVEHLHFLTSSAVGFLSGAEPLQRTPGDQVLSSEGRALGTFCLGFLLESFSVISGMCISFIHLCCLRSSKTTDPTLLFWQVPVPAPSCFCVFQSHPSVPLSYSCS